MIMPKITATYLRNLLSALLLRPDLNSDEDYLCLGIATAVTNYSIDQLMRDVNVYPAEVRLLWFINIYLITLEHEDVLGDGKRFTKRAIRWMFKECSDDMKPFLGDDMEVKYNIFVRDIVKLEQQRVAQNHPDQTPHECCVAMFENTYNRNGDITTTQNVMECILKSLEHADGL